MAKKKKQEEKMLKITQIRSLIGRRADHRRTIEALGLKRLNHSVIKKDTPQIRGMIKKVQYLVSVEEVE
ncbi:MAG: 50S ribosomal protein L30 [Calditrichaeota bacterium]|nr:MAG: 50S ribosomal protein L30 [Calditrichota bacterium]